MKVHTQYEIQVMNHKGGKKMEMGFVLMNEGMNGLI
jgi:hypothetical protein